MILKKSNINLNRNWFDPSLFSNRFCFARQKSNQKRLWQTKFDDFSSKSEKCHKKRFKHHIHSQNSIYSVKLEKLSKIYVQSVAHSVLMPVKRVMTEKFCLSCRTEAKHFWWNLHGTDNLLPYFYEFFNHLYILFACILLFIFFKIL